jgi:hypothetical protein
MIDFVQFTNDVNEKYSDLFAPFSNLLGCDIMSAQEFDGTLFRFPLRSQQQEQSFRSKISENLLEPIAARDLLDKFTLESVTDVIFLKHVASVKVMIYDDGMSEPQLIHSMDISFPSTRDEQNRKHVNTILSNAATIVNQDDYLDNYTYEMCIRESRPSINNIESKWIVSCVLGGDQVRELSKKEFEKNPFSKKIPFGAVAAKISSTSKTISQSFNTSRQFSCTRRATCVLLPTTPLTYRFTRFC